MQQNLGCDDESANDGFYKPKSADTCPLAKLGNRRELAKEIYNEFI